MPSIVAHFQPKQVKNRAKVNIYLLVFVSPRENRRPKTAKFKIYFNFEDCGGFRCGSPFGAVVVSTGGRCAGFRGFRTCLNAGSGPLVVCSLFLSSFSLCLWCVVLEYALISRFKGVLEGFPCWMWVCVVLVICVACVAFVRVWS